MCLPPSTCIPQQPDFAEQTHHYTWRCKSSSPQSSRMPTRLSRWECCRERSARSIHNSSGRLQWSNNIETCFTKRRIQTYSADSILLFQSADHLRQLDCICPTTYPCPCLPTKYLLSSMPINPCVSQNICASVCMLITSVLFKIDQFLLEYDSLSRTFKNTYFLQRVRAYSVETFIKFHRLLGLCSVFKPCDRLYSAFLNSDMPEGLA